MLFERPIFPSDGTAPDFIKSREQSWYLLGVELADETYRLDKNFDRKLIDPCCGTGSKAFWRAVLESAGLIALHAGGGGERRYPKIRLKGSHAFLTVFLQFLEEELGAPGPLTRGNFCQKFDSDGKLAWQTMGEFVEIKGTRARDIVRLLYIGETVGRETPRRTADSIVTWEPARRY